MVDVIFLVLGFAILIAVPIVLFFILRRIWRVGWIGKSIAIGIGSYLLFSIYTAIWPLDGFYIKEFEHHSGVMLPKSAVVIDKQATYPDIHGDYSSEAVIQISKNDFENIKTRSQRHDVECSFPTMVKIHISPNISPIGCWTIESNLHGYEYFVWMIFSDNRTIYFEYWSS